MIEIPLDTHASLTIHAQDTGDLPAHLHGNRQYRAVTLSDDWPGRHWTRPYIAKWPPRREAPSQAEAWTRTDISGVMLLVRSGKHRCELCRTEVPGLVLPVEAVPVLGFNAAWHPRLICCPHCAAATGGTRLSSLIVALESPTPESAPHLYRQSDVAPFWQPPVS